MVGPMVGPGFAKTATQVALSTSISSGCRWQLWGSICSRRLKTNSRNRLTLCACIPTVGCDRLLSQVSQQYKWAGDWSTWKSQTIRWVYTTTCRLHSNAQAENFSTLVPEREHLWRCYESSEQNGQQYVCSRSITLHCKLQHQEFTSIMFPLSTLYICFYDLELYISPFSYLVFHLYFAVSSKCLHAMYVVGVVTLQLVFSYLITSNRTFILWPNT